MTARGGAAGGFGFLWLILSAAAVIRQSVDKRWEKKGVSILRHE
jgi:hypothetical protein